MTDPKIEGGNLILPSGPVPIPPGLLDKKAFSKTGAIDGRSTAGRALKGWCAEQMASQAPQKPQDSQFAPEGVDHPSEAAAASATLSGDSSDMVSEYRETPAPAAPAIPEQTPAAQPAPLPFGDMPRLGSHESAKRLVEIIIELYPDAKPIDWRSCQAMLQNAMRYGQLWGDLQRK